MLFLTEYSPFLYSQRAMWKAKTLANKTFFTDISCADSNNCMICGDYYAINRQFIRHPMEVTLGK